MPHSLEGGASHPVVITGINQDNVKIYGGASRPVFWTGVTQAVLDQLEILLGGPFWPHPTNGLIVDAGKTPNGTNLFTTVGAAMAVASSGDLIIVVTDTTESAEITWVNGVNVFCFPGRTVSSINRFVITDITGEWFGGALTTTGGGARVFEFTGTNTFSVRNCVITGINIPFIIISGATNLLIENCLAQTPTGSTIVIDCVSGTICTLEFNDCRFVANGNDTITIIGGVAHILKMSNCYTETGSGSALRFVGSSIDLSNSRIDNCQFVGTVLAVNSTVSFADFPAEHCEFTGGVTNVIFSDFNQSNTIDGASTNVVGYVSITVENPGAAEDINMGFFEHAITLVEMQAVIVGSDTPSVTIDPFHTLDRSAAGTDILAVPLAITNETTGQNVTSFDDDTIPVDSWLVLPTTAQSGTVTELTVTFKYTYD